MLAASLRFKIILAFLCLYIVWGTPFLARKFAIQSIPPLMSEGIRFTIAGGLVCLFQWFRLRQPVNRRHWRDAFIIGGFLLLGGNGAVVWAQQVIPSGVAALFIGTVPMWTVLVDWLWHPTRTSSPREESRSKRLRGWHPTRTSIPREESRSKKLRKWERGEPPPLSVLIAIATGFIGVMMLAAPWRHGAEHLPALECVVLLLSALSWAVGSVYAKRARLHENLSLAIGTQMFAGGVLLLTAGAFAGEFVRFDLSRVSPRSALALLYLIVFASIIGFNIYIWLLNKIPPTQVSTYAYINPIVAMALGWKFAAETVTRQMFISSILIVLSVAVIVSMSPKLRGKQPEPLEPQ